MNSLTIEIEKGGYKDICLALDRLVEEFYEPANIRVKCDQFDSNIDTDWDPDPWLQKSWSKPEVVLTNIKVYGCTVDDLRYADEEERRDVVEHYISSLDEEPVVSYLDRSEEIAKGMEQLAKALGIDFSKDGEWFV